MIKEVKVGIVSDNTVATQGLEKILETQFKQIKETQLRIKVFGHLPSLEDAVVNYAPRILLIHIEEKDRTEKLAFLSQLTSVASRIPIIVFANDIDSDLMLQCVKKGVCDFLKYPFETAEIRETLGRILEKASFDTDTQRLGTLYTFFSYKGGVGTTFLACNTAVALAQNAGKKVLLWDMVLQNGDVPFFLDHDPKVTVTELLQEMGSIDAPYLQNALPVHESGISILAGPKNPEEAETVTHEHVQQLYHILRKFYDYIVVDAGRTFTDPVIAIMDACHYIVFPIDLHLPVLKNTLRCIEVFEKFGYVEEKFKIVVNRYNSKFGEIDVEKAQKILPHPIAFTFFNEYLLASRSLNTGIPVLDLDKKSPLAKQFVDFAQLLVDGFEIRTKEKKSFLQELFGKMAVAPKKAKAEKA